MLSTLLLVTSLASTAFAGDRDPTGASGLTSARFAEVADSLGLSEDQRDRVSDAIYKSNSARVDIDARVEKAKLDLRHLLAADTVDEKAVLKATDALSAAESDLRRNRVELVLTVRKVLTAAQWDQLVELRQERRAERRREHDDD